VSLEARVAGWHVALVPRAYWGWGPGVESWSKLRKSPWQQDALIPNPNPTPTPTQNFERFDEDVAMSSPSGGGKKWAKADPNFIG